MQLQIERLVNYLCDLYPGFWYYREWPCHAKVKFDVLLKNEQEWLYIKAFTDDEYWRKTYENEIRLIQLFNKFSKEKSLKFLWPKITYNNDVSLFFIMEDIEFSWKKLLDFREISREEAVKHFYQYRKVFDDFEIYCGDNWYDMVDICNGYSIEDLIEKCKWWYFRWEHIVEENNVLLDFQAIESKIIELYNCYWKNIFPRELSFKWFWTWHVFEWDGEYQLIDFDYDSVWFEIKWKSICRLACYYVALSVDRYGSYEDRKLDFERWRKEMLKINEKPLVDILILSSLIWVLYADYAGTMVIENYNRDMLEKEWINPEDNAKKWMQRCAKLIREWYGIK